MEELAVRFARGDAADDLRSQLAARVAEIGRWIATMNGPLPDPVQAAITRLLTRVQTTTQTGESWLEQATAELAPRTTQVRLQRAYGLRPRDP